MGYLLDTNVLVSARRSSIDAALVKPNHEVAPPSYRRGHDRG